ncbi:hypothetical protein O181_065403 [Austropuccinia psidii MF-1]|uniref:Uncharacterized protein n=1 Tax=Austropuccinia psidii MF-1 TaxID=1389203 RepID=A0A9Q3EVA5_9BASI|nr:hypothetical protein [Austropuccinia psidii MF-1]
MPTAIGQSTIGPGGFGPTSLHSSLGKRLIGSMFGRHLKRSGNWKTLRLPDAHGMGCFLCSNASTVGLSQWSNDIGQDGAASLLTGPAPVHSLDGAGPLDTWSPAHLTDGG